eukprot:scaffold722_cov147-Skeletonema_menzelii.AAC.5
MGGRCLVLPSARSVAVAYIKYLSLESGERCEDMTPNLMDFFGSPVSGHSVRQATSRPAAVLSNLQSQAAAKAASHRQEAEAKSVQSPGTQVALPALRAE